MIVATGLALAACGSSARGDSAVAASACGSGTPVAGRPIRLVTTVAPITSIVANIAGGSGAEIRGIVPEGTNSHTFEPAPSAAQAMEKADVVFINGLALEDPTKKMAQANMPKSAEICELGTSILPESEWIYDFSFPKEGGKPNPHLWTNPPMAKDYGRVVRDTLVKRDPANKAAYEKNYAAFATKVDALDAAMKLATATLPQTDRKLLTYHDAYAYFSKQYGWDVIGAIQPSSFDEPTPKEVAALIDQIKAEKVKAIFGSEVFPSPVLEQIGKETGTRYVDVLRDDDLLGEPGDAEHSWLGLMRFDYTTMVESLDGDASALKALDVSDVAPDTADYPQ